MSIVISNFRQPNGSILQSINLKPDTLDLCDSTGKYSVDFTQIVPFVPFKHGQAVFGGYFGDEGKGKEVDISAQKYKNAGYKILSIRGQGSGNAGHTVVVDGKKFDFHYLTSAGLLADIMLLGPGMLIDPIRLLEEAKQLPGDRGKIIKVAERATIVSNLERAMDGWVENQRTNSGQKAIGTTKSGVGPGVGNRGYRVHVTFADALHCKNISEFMDLYLKNPLLPNEVKSVLDFEYAEELWDAIQKLDVVDSVELISYCRTARNWAVLLEVSQAVLLDPLFGNGGHFCTSMTCTDIGGAAFAGLTMHDFSDGSNLILKAYGSKVGGGPYITKFTPEEQNIADFIDDMVGEHGVTTGRKRDLGWFDAPAVRHSINLTGADICVNCMDVIAALPAVTDHVKVCFAYKNKITDEVTYNWPYHLDDYEPLYVSLPINDKTEVQIIAEYILLIEMLIGRKIKGYGVGPSREDYRNREAAFDYLM